MSRSRTRHEIRGEVPYLYKGHTTSVHGVNLYVCLRCGYESIPSGCTQHWLEQTARFRAEIDAQGPAQELRPESLKDKIMVEWLCLDPDQLANDAETEIGGYISWETLARYAEQHRNKVFEAFAAYKQSHTTDRPERACLQDWHEFLGALHKARTTAADPHWEVPRDGVVYNNKA